MSIERVGEIDIVVLFGEYCEIDIVVLYGGEYCEIDIVVRYGGEYCEINIVYICYRMVVDGGIQYSPVNKVTHNVRLHLFNIYVGRTGSMNQ